MRLSAVVIVTTIMAVCMSAWGQAPEPADEESSAVLAIVDGRPVTADELWWYMSQTSGGRLLDDLILSRLLAVEAAAQGVKVAEPDVDDALAALRAGYASETAFERWLIESGQTLKGLRMQLQQELLIEALLTERMGLTEAGIEEYYAAHPDEFSEPPRVHLLDIVALTLDEAFAARERLAAGESFADVAREMSHDPTAEQGGDRGWLVPHDVLRAEVAEVVFAMEAGEVSDPVDCGDHFHVFYAREVEPGRLIPLAEAHDQVVERIREVRGITRELLIALLKRRAGIEVLWDEHRYLNDYYADLRAYRVAVDDVVLDLPAAPRLLAGGNLIVPAQAVLEAMGAEVTWTPESGVLEATRDDVRIRLVAGSSMFAAGGEELAMKEPARVEGDVLMIAPRAPIEALGGSLQWNRADNTLYVRSRAEVEGEG